MAAPPPSVVTCPTPAQARSTIQQPDRQVLCSVACLCCQFSRTLRKETNSSDFVTRLVLFPRRKEREGRWSGRDTYLVRAGRGSILADLVVVKITSQKQPATDLSWIPPSLPRFCGQCAPRSIMKSQDISIDLPVTPWLSGDWR